LAKIWSEQTGFSEVDEMEKGLNLITQVPTRQEIEYPESDGKPMGETQVHIKAMGYLYAALEFFFRIVEQVYISSNMLFYYEEGNPSAFVVPDVFVVKGIAKHLRRTYKLWEERIAPCVVFELTSRSTRLDDLGNKRALYEELGVREYFLFDPLDEYLKPRLQGFRLTAVGYQPMASSLNGTLRSEELGLILRPEGGLLRLVDPTNGEPLPTLDEAMDLAHAEAQRANRAEAELARVHTELARLGGKGTS
jgi:Uma2 family endonuclease